MDFLSLFPTTSQQSLLIFSSYRQMGFLCWSAAKQNELLLISAIKNDTGNNNMPQNVLFKNVSTISLSPELPRNVDFHEILVNQTGSLVALVGKRMVFVVEMDPEFWDRRHIPGLNFEASIEHLRPHYFARSDLVHITLFLRKYPPSVLKVVWFESQSDENFVSKFDRTNTQVPSGFLALLFSDNVIRLYNIPSLIDRPHAQLDFNSLLPDWSPTSSENGDEIGGIEGISRPHSALGFVTQLVSFDFGPVHIQSFEGPSTQSTISYLLVGSLLAMDSNGEIYTGFFPFLQHQNSAPLKIPAPFGPLSFHFPKAQPPISSRLICTALDLHSIRYSHSQLISLWALATEDGTIIHFILSQRNEGKLSGDLFELFALECLEVEGNGQSKHDPKKIKWDLTKSTKSDTTNLQMTKMLRLINDLANASSPSYYAICSRDLFRVDLIELTVHLIQNCATINSQSRQFDPSIQSAKLPQTNIHHLLMFMDDKEAKISSVSSLELPATTFLGPSTSSLALENFNKERQHFLVALCSNSKKSNPIDEEKGKMGSAGQWKHSFMATLINARSTIISSPLLSDSFILPLSTKQKRTIPTLPSISEEIRRQLVGQQNCNILPNIKFSEEVHGESRDDGQKIEQRLKHLSLFQNVLQNFLLKQAFPARQKAIEFTAQKAVHLLASFQAIEEFRENVKQRLTVIFRQIIDLKSQILRRQRQIQILEERIEKISLALQPLMFPAPKEETEAIENLRGMEQRMAECHCETKKLDQRLCEHRQLLFGNSNNAFRASSQLITKNKAGGGPMPAQMFILSKNGRNCAKLREQIQQLMEDKNSG